MDFRAPKKGNYAVRVERRAARVRRCFCEYETPPRARRVLVIAWIRVSSSSSSSPGSSPNWSSSPSLPRSSPSPFSPSPSIPPLARVSRASPLSRRVARAAASLSLPSRRRALNRLHASTLAFLHRFLEHRPVLALYLRHARVRRHRRGQRDEELPRVPIPSLFARARENLSSRHRS